MTALFLDQDLHPVFEKLSASVKLSDNPDNWQREIASEVFKQLPYLADFSVNVVLDRVDPQRGYAFGSAEVSNQTDSPIPDQPEESVHIPIIVKDRMMHPLDVMLDGKEALPLNERRLREKLFRTASFESSTRKPTDQGMVDQLYPPMRTNYGYGNSVATGAGVGGFGKQASLCKAIASTVSDHQYETFLGKIASDEETRLLFLKNASIRKISNQLASTPPVGVEKTAQALVRSIKPTVVQFTKLASGNFRVKWANAAAFAPQEGQISPDQAGAMAGQDLSQMQPGQTMTVSTQRAQKQGLDEPDGTVIKEFGDYSVKNADTGETLVGTVLPVVDFQMQPLEFFVFTDGAGHYGAQDEIIGVRQDGPGGMALQEQEEAPMAPITPDASGAPPSPQPDQGGMPKVAVSDKWIKDMVQSGAKKAPLSRLSKFVNGRLSDAGRLNETMWGGGKKPSQQAQALQKKHWDSYATARDIQLDRTYPTKTASAQPQGDGVFVYHPQAGGKPFCTLPITIESTTQGPDGSVTLMASDVFGAKLNLVLTPGISSFETLDEDGSIAIPDDMQWVSLMGEPIHLAKGDTPDAAADAKGLPNEVAVKSTGPGEVSMEGMPLAKVARDQRWFQKTADAVFLLCTMGLTQQEAQTVIKEAESRESHCVKLAGLLPITPLWEVHAKMEKKAEALIAQFDYDFWKRDLVKEAAALEDSETADKVLAMNFINPENLSIFASYLPDLDDTSMKLAEVLLASRLGMSQVPEGAAERAMKNMEDVIGGLRSLQQKELI